MAKRSRTRLAQQQAPAAPVTSRRTTRRRTVRRSSEPTLLERYGSWLLGGLVVIGIGLIVAVAVLSGTQPAYACGEQLTPGPSEPTPTERPSPSPTPTPSPAPSLTVAPSASATGSPGPSPTTAASPSVPPSGSPGASPTASPSPSASPSPTPIPTAEPQPTARLGFTTVDLGTNHNPNAAGSIRYAFCPPTSGEHFNNANAPMDPAVYGASQEQAPGNWIHNLEHGYVVAAYRCPSGTVGAADCISQAEMDQLTQWYNQAPEPTVSQCAKKALVVRFDAMDTRFAILAWNRALLVNQFDVPTALTFAQQWMEHPSVPEPNAC